MNTLSCDNHFLSLDPRIQKNSRKAKVVLIITALTMVLEIYFGYVTGSMALLADGWHMATHAAALGITYLAYRLAISPTMTKNFNFGGGKILALGGFASSVFLLCVVALIGFESVKRFIHPQDIQFNEALIVAVIGLLVNIVCAWILRDSADAHGHTHEHGHAHNHEGHAHAHGHSHEAHDHSHGAHDHTHTSSGDDHNIRGAYIHVLADALTSVGAIVALLAGRFWGLNFLDPLIGLVGAIVIFRWAIGLIRDTGWELLDGHAKGVNFDQLKTRVESVGGVIQDMHVWKIAPNVLTAELVLKNPHGQNVNQLTQKTRAILEAEFNVRHSVIEVRGL